MSLPAQLDFKNDVEWNMSYFWFMWERFSDRRYFTINNHNLRIYTRATPLELSDLRCKHSFTIGVERFLLWKKCPVCEPIPCASAGEMTVRAYLQSKFIEFQTEKTFPTCKYKGLLRFDIFVPKKLLIEVHGPHHYKPVSYSSDKSEKAKQEYFNLVTLRDNIKRQWCIDNHFTLVELSYSDLQNLDVSLLPILEKIIMKKR